MSVIQVVNARKDYGSKLELKVVLNNFSMEVQQGSIYAMMGSSGCGKTTLINCLVGTISLDSGSIRIFGESPKRSRPRIGFMPQETALINEFTIREMIWFYGTIYGLDSNEINERFLFFCKLLELPPSDRLVRDCSGGQQRRISFAVSLVHQPEVLILDEPTVGVDPLLRAKIWDYLVDITKTKNVTVLLSTHYIEEASQSTHVGLMRNGVQVAEDSPNNILAALDVASLEDAFLRLCHQQDNGELNSKQFQTLQSANFDSLKFSMLSVREEDVTKQSSAKIIKALLKKNLLQFVRNFIFVIFIIALPILCCFSMHNCIGGSFSDLKIGIVNEEITSAIECQNHSVVTIELNDFQCILSKASCRFIDEFDDETAEKMFFASYQEAFGAAKRGEVLGFIHFSANYTESMAAFKTDFFNYSEGGIIHVYLDRTVFQKAAFVEKKLYEAHQRYMEKLMVACGRSKKALNSPLRLEAFRGDLDFDQKKSILSGFVLSGFFIISSYFLAVSVLSDRAGGSWDRTIIAGAKPQHYLLSHIVEGLFLITINFMTFAFYVIFLLTPNLDVESMKLSLAMIYLFGLYGLVFGLLLSIVLKTEKESLLAIMSTVFPAMFTSGMLWPVEGMPKLLQLISKIFPFTISVAAYRKIITNSATIWNQTVYGAFIMLIIWIVGLLSMSFWLCREKPYRKNEKS